MRYIFNISQLKYLTQKTNWTIIFFIEIHDFLIPCIPLIHFMSSHNIFKIMHQKHHFEILQGVVYLFSIK